MIAYIRALSTSEPNRQALVQPILTTSVFAISCTEDLLSAIGQLAKREPTLRIQTHLAENPSEVTLLNPSFAHCSTYAQVYQEYGLLNERTILAHCVHLEDDEVEFDWQN